MSCLVQNYGGVVSFAHSPLFGPLLLAVRTSPQFLLHALLLVLFAGDARRVLHAVDENMKVALSYQMCQR